MGTALGELDRALVELYRRAAALLGTADDLEATLGQVIELCLPAVGDFGFLDLVLDEGEVRRTSRAHEDPTTAALLAPTRWVRQEGGDKNLCALSSGALALHADTDDAWMVDIAQSPEHLDLLRRLAFRSMLTVPISLHGDTLGAMTLFFGRSGRRHGPHERALATELAALVAPLLVTARLFERQRRTEDALRASEERLRLALDAGRLGIWDWDIAADRIEWSERHHEHHGLAPGEFGGRVADFAALVHPDDRERVAARIDASLAGGDAFEIEFRTVRPDGEVRWLGTRAAVVRDADGTPRRMLGASFDVTDRRALLDAERAARADAERASRAKDEFLAMLGHELRNPLAPIAATLEVLRRRDDPSIARERAVLDRQVAHLARLVDDLLDVARIARGAVELQRERLELGAILAQAAETVAPLYAGRDVALAIDPTGAADAHVDGDRVRLEQVFTNLLSNAARYSEPGGRVAVAARREGDALVIEVRDAGIGIAPDFLPHVFDLFVQGPRPLDRAAGGLGLGLSIVKNLVERHGGEVSAASEGAGRGSTFTVRLPDAGGPGAAASDRATTDVPGGRSARLLVVDDNVDAADVLAELLREAGYQVEVAYDGAAALRVLGDRVPDAAILDLGLPGIDGYELARRVRAELGLAALPLVALTGYGGPADRARVTEAGFDAHLVKPVALAALQRTLDQLLGRAG